MIDLYKKRVCVTGGAGFFGRRIVEELFKGGCKHVFVPRSSFYDLRTEKDIRSMLCYHPSDIIIHAAAQAGGIGLNQNKPAELFYNNAVMGALLMNQAYKWGVEKFIQIGTVCEYPKLTETPFREEDLWKGYPEETNAPYGVAKKSLLVMGQAYRQQYGFNVIHLLPVNLYGPGDNFKIESSHVIPALIRKFVEAKKTDESTVKLWGTGNASREFLYVEDAAKAVVKATQLYDKADPINIGSGKEIKISSLALMIGSMVGYEGEITFDPSKPDGQPRRLLDTRKALEEFGFVATTDLKDGLRKTIDWYTKGG